MNKFNGIIKIAAAIFAIGALFLSCAGGGGGGGPNDLGTLVIDLSKSESLVSGFSPSFRGNLQYEIECTSPGQKAVKKTANPGTSSVTVALAAGTWDVAIKVVNKEDPENALGVETITGISIEANETVTREPDAIVIDTSRCEIAGFILKIGTNNYSGDIQGTVITVSVPAAVYNNASAEITLQITHTGKGCEHPNPTNLQPLLSGSFSVTVTAENGNTKTYTVQVVEEKTPPIEGGTTGWPAASVWQNFGFPQGIERPQGYQSYYNAASNMLSAGLYDAGKPAFDHIVSEIVKNGYTNGTSSSGSSGFYEYGLEFEYDGKDFVLEMFTSGTSAYNNYPSNHLAITIVNKSYDPDVTYSWPANNVLSRFGLSGLTQPGGTTVEVLLVDFSGDFGGLAQAEGITIEIFGGGNAAYENLLNQIKGMNNPKFDHTNRDSSSMRQDRFEYENQSGMSFIGREVNLEMSKTGSNQKVVLDAEYSTFSFSF
ncbi:MAG: hypothetical protein FWG99_06550 [Treponema sp.]|nr:hypothetical protein [Treponema sp.]